MSAPSEEAPSARSLRAFVSKRRASAFGLGKRDEKKGVLRRGKTVLKNVAGGVRKSVSVGEGLLVKRENDEFKHENDEFQKRECESATLLSVRKDVLQEKALENARVGDDDHIILCESSKESKQDDVETNKEAVVSDKPRKTVTIDLNDSESSKRSKEDGAVTSKEDVVSNKPRKTVTIDLRDQSSEVSKLEMPADQESEGPTPPAQEAENGAPEKSLAIQPGVRTSYRKHSIRVDAAPDDGGMSYVAHTGRIKTTGIVERSVAAAVISAARQRGLSKKGKAPPPSRPVHHRPHGGYCNPWESALKESGIRTRGGSGSRTFFHKVAKDRRPPDEQLAGMLLLASRPDFGEGKEALENDKYALASYWIGHSTFLLQTKGITILTDPVWSLRLGPLGPKRLVPPPCGIGDLPDVIDVVILSSACYDAFDKHAVQLLAPKVHMWLVPLGVKVLLTSIGVDDTKITELDWWQEYRVKGCMFACTPAQHYSVRDDALWCSWVVHASHHRMFFCGATGYRSVQREAEDSDSYDYRGQFGGPSCPAFKEISRRYGACDTAFLPIGGFKPRVLMSGVQGDAIDMLSVHRDLRSRRSIAHRWGTFSCAEEGMLDSVRTLEAGILSSPIAEHEFSYLKHGRLHVT